MDSSPREESSSRMKRKEEEEVFKLSRHDCLPAAAFFVQRLLISHREKREGSREKEPLLPTKANELSGFAQTFFLLALEGTAKLGEGGGGKNEKSSLLLGLLPFGI